VWRPLFEHLAPRRELIAIDLPGFGESPPLPNGSESNPYSLTDAVVAFLDELGLDRPAVAGNSLGGWISLELARRGRARAVAPIDPAGFQLPRERAYSTRRLAFDARVARLGDPHLLPALRNTAVRTVAFSHMVGKPWKIPPDDAMAMARNLAVSPAFDATLEAMSDLTFAGGDEIRVPVTLIWGTRDHVLIPRQAERAQRVLPTARLHWLRGAGHVPTYDAPAEIARLIAEL
jgi:pimeloyl-ACP methyl ester carboxylesterase